MVVPPQEADRTMQLDTYDHVDLTGPWAGFGFQGYRFFTPEGREVRPEEMRWWSLTCTIAREWSTMMREERNARSAKPGKACGAKVSKKSTSAGDVSAGCQVIYLRDVLQQRREQRSSVGG
ncbi:DUF3653 domain-containing protein [Xanthomonas campestris]|uniref:DUF3653 domain-containing protein n=2 Tax=Xanthomonas campestris TaxID=339 RepID=UPI003D8119E5